MDSSTDVQYDMLYSITLQANIAEFLISNADTIFDDKFSSLSRRVDLNTFAKSHRPISVCHTTGAKLLSLEEAQARDKQYKQVGPVEVPKFHTVIELNTNGKKKDKDNKIKRKNSSNSKNKKNKNDIQQSASSSTMTQSVISSSTDVTMTSSLMSTKTVNAPQLPQLMNQQMVNSQSQQLPLQPPPPIATPGPQIQQPLTSAKSFMRGIRSGSTKSSQRELNNEQQIASPLTNDAYSSIRSSNSVHIANNNQTSNNTSSFVSNKIRSSSIITKNSPIPPPRVAIVEQDDQPFNSLPRNLDLMSNTKQPIQGSPIMSTFRQDYDSKQRGKCFFIITHAISQTMEWHIQKVDKRIFINSLMTFSSSELDFSNLQ